MTANRTILIRSWRFLPHSYAIVNAFQCLELLRRPEVTLYFEDVRYASRKWAPVRGLFPPAAEEALARLAPPPADLVPDAELRLAFPYDLQSPARAKRTCVFGTAEFNSVPARFVAGNVTIAEAHRAAPGVIIITPSNWSREGFIRSGADPDRVVVIPHGVDPDLFRPPTHAERAAARASFPVRGNSDEDDFTFLHIGTMAQNKGVGLLLQAFAQVLSKHPRARLLLKGLDSLYNSTQAVRQYISVLPPTEARRVAARIDYVGAPLPFAQLATLYHAADCYVAPYFAEGFNLPSLEAAACGLPLICTAGGPTDDFITPEFALRIDSHLADTPGPQAPEARTLIPSLDSLVAQMLRVIEDPAFRDQARAAGPRHVAGGFTWSKVVDRLLAVLLPP